MDNQKTKDLFPLIIILIGVVSILVGSVATIIVYKIYSPFFIIMASAGALILIIGLLCEFYKEKPAEKVEETTEEKE